jgi:hypothetical protein
MVKAWLLSIWPLLPNNGDISAGGWGLQIHSEVQTMISMIWYYDKYDMVETKRHFCAIKAAA